MKLIIGGAYQGKRQYAAEHYASLKIIPDFHLTVLEMLKNGTDPLLFVKGHLPDYQGKVILCDDISCGVVPEDALLRKWREALGHVLAVLAKESSEVVRVFCGIGIRLK